nr:unnamed protein product [Callosobruchus chinensis]
MNAVATSQANGQVEGLIRTKVEVSSTAETKGRWYKVLPDVVWGLNSTSNASTRFAPADLMFSHSRSRVANLAGELASDQPSTVTGDSIPTNTANVSRNAVVVPRYTAALEEAYVPGVKITQKDSARPVNDALSQVVGSEALDPAETVISTQAGETDQPMANVGDTDLDTAGGSNAATVGRQKRVHLSNDSNGTNQEVQGDDLAHVSPTAGVRRKKHKLAGVRRWRPEPTQRSEGLLQSDDCHIETNGNIIKNDLDPVVINQPLLFPDLNQDHPSLPETTFNLNLDLIKLDELSDIKTRISQNARASGETALNGDTLGRSHCATASDPCGDTSSRAQHRVCIATDCETCLVSSLAKMRCSVSSPSRRCLESSLSQRCPVFWPQSKACGESSCVGRGSSIGSTGRNRRTATANGDSGTEGQACSSSWRRRKLITYTSGVHRRWRIFPGRENE